MAKETEDATQVVPQVGFLKRTHTVWRYEMAGTVSMHVDAEAVIDAVKRMKRRDREAFLENLLAATSPEYLASIREARRQYRAGKVKSHVEVFGR